MHVEYAQTLSELRKQFDEFKIKAARAWDVADDKWDSAGKELEQSWEEWVVRAKHAWDDLSK